MKILILGSHGFIGSHLANYYKSNDFVVWGCDLSIEPHQNNYYQIKKQGVQWNEIFADQQFDYCINAAGSGNINNSVLAPVPDFSSNTFDTIQILEAIRTSNKQCKYIHISSAAVYGNPLSLPITESSDCNPISPYGWHKLMSELLCKEYHQIYELSVAIVRPFSVYGPGLKKQLLWDIYQKTLLRNKMLELSGTGNEARDFIYIDDLLLAIDTILKHAPMKAEIYNIASGEMTTIGDIAKLLLFKINYTGTLIFNGKQRVGNPEKWKADITRIKELGFKSDFTLENGINKLANWLQQKV
jgi:dTDP-glucose 4,6-dehydratase/UDP-glucose 4-epimerase